MKLLPYIETDNAENQDYKYVIVRIKWLWFYIGKPINIATTLQKYPAFCDGCGSENIKKIIRSDGSEAVRCRTCGKILKRKKQ